jgi:lipoate-protein ligase A
MRADPPPSGPIGGGIRWIPPLRRDGALQMAIDEWMLDAVLQSEAAGMLRFYRWSRPSLSLGFHQRRLEERWQTLAQAGRLDLVRRPSGGRAVLHGGCLTYALVWRRPPRSRSLAYRQACRWLQEGFAGLGRPLVFGRQVASAAHGSCFATSTAADLVHPGGAKRIGSAQLWRAGAVLQHGTILLRPPRALWREVFGVDPPPLPDLGLGPEQLILRLREAARRHLPIDGPLREGGLSAGEWAAIGRRRGRYRPSSPGAGPTSPEATMARAT